MKSIFKILTICLFVTLSACKNETPEIKTIETEEIASVVSTENPYKDYAKVEFNVEGMKIILIVEENAFLFI